MATSDAIDVTTISTSRGLVTFTFSGANKITLTASTKYFAVCEYTTGGGTNGLYIWADVTSPTHGGNLWTDPGGANNTIDLGHYLYVDDAVSTAIKKVSGVAYASIKKISGVAIASVKKVAGLA